MLETKNLTKVYKPKKGVAVKALDGVSLRFPEKGMIFLLGKSGSGKSTLLNLLGGLDKYDSGDILIKGVSSKDFTQSHFDSYRNTYVGFIFQEYNVLEEFTVGANIALAMELQGQKATDEKLNKILREVDLDGYGSRKPSELSGGQKQRVAIARALVKNPQIIMADEPTGALDSATGRQVLDTLKKLSKEKLVIIVSHDRDFAVKYADRIIELSDGKVISDVEFFADNEPCAAENDGIAFKGEQITVTKGYRLSEEDRERINEYIDMLNKGVTIDITSSSKRKTRDVDNSKIKNEDTSPFKLIKSKLPMKNAFKIGAGGLKHKKIRLVITILLSCVAFGLFGLADTFGAYDHIKTCTNSIIDTNITYASVVRSKKIKLGDREIFYQRGFYMGDGDIEKIKNETGIDMKGVYVPKGERLSFRAQTDETIELTSTNFQIYSTGFSGFIEADEDFLKEMNYNLIAGKLPDGSKNEAAISDYTARTFIKAGYIAPNEQSVQKISGYADLVGKKLMICGDEYTVTGIVDTKFDFERYERLIKADPDKDNAEMLVDYALANELSYIQDYSMAQALMVGSSHVSHLAENAVSTKELSFGYVNYSLGDVSDDLFIFPEFVGTLKDVPADSIVWLDGEKKSLADGEIIISSDTLNLYDTEISDGEDRVAERLRSCGSLTKYAYVYGEDKDIDVPAETKIVGYIDSSKSVSLANTVIMSDGEFKKAPVDMEGGIYNYAVGPMPKDRSDIQKFVSFAYDESGDVKYPVMNSVSYELDTVNSVLKTCSKWFLYIGIGFAVFASVMLANFIGTSIAYKKQEIGILRAIGSRSNDVFRIFFSESFIIALINFVLSCTGVAAAVALINHILRNDVGIYITVLSFGARQFLLLLAVSLATAAAASFVPVKRIASKRPIDAIRNR